MAGLRRGKAKIKINGNFSNIDWSTIASADGAYPISLSTNGTLSLSTAQSRLSVEKLEGKFAEQAIGLGAPFAVTWQARGWRVKPLDFSLAGGRFRLAGSMAGGVLDANGQFDNLPLRLASLIDPRFQVDGSVAGKLQASGASQDPALTMSFAARNIRSPDVTKTKFAGFNLAVDVRQGSGIARATANLTGPDQTSATLSLKTQTLFSLSPMSLALGPDLPITGDLMANGQLGLIDRLVGLGDDRIAGLISTKAKITGTLGKPVIHGDARLSGGSYEGAATGTVLRKIEGHVIFSGDSARLVALSAGDGAKGRLSGTGVVQFAGAGASSGGVDIKLDRFTALRHPLAEATVTGGMTLSGSLEAPHLAGRMQVDKGEIRIPDQLPEQIIELEFVEINGQTENVENPAVAREPSLAKTFPVSLDLTLNFPHRIFVRGRGLDSEWKGDITVSGKTDAPIIKGKLQAIRGTFAFAGKSFAVKSGSVFFPNSAAEPEIEAVAEATLKDLVARVEISGNVSKPAINISSDPALPQEDVLAHILFGRTTSQLSAIQAAQLAETAATLSGRGGTGIMDKVRQALGVDVLNVETEKGSGKGASLKAGKYVTEEIFLSVTQGTQAGSQKVGVEVQVLPNITVESDISGSADSNIGLNWKWDY
ncbi:MAG: translocation/assembly module TamB domain-containing protein [Proteobacteria bacterium]|nr:translocation/assembly module TamB domain-containing protein [Pseudomonadota bacterium]